MINFDEVVNDTPITHNENWPYVPDFPYRILIVGGSGSGKTNALLNLISRQEDIDKIYLYVKDPYEPKYQFLINKRQAVGKNIVTIVMLLLSIQTTLMMFTTILTIIILVKVVKF